MGDRNTKFFHATTLNKRRKNKITLLQKSDGIWLDNSDDIIVEIKNNLALIFSTMTKTHPPSRLYLNMLPQLTQIEKENLITSPDHEEIKEALWSTHLP